MATVTLRGSEGYELRVGARCLTQGAVAALFLRREPVLLGAETLSVCLPDAHTLRFAELSDDDVFMVLEVDEVRRCLASGGSGGGGGDDDGAAAAEGGALLEGGDGGGGGETATEAAAAAEAALAQQRERLRALTAARRRFIAAHHVLLHPELREFDAERFLDPRLARVLAARSSWDGVPALAERLTPTGLYRLPCLRPEICAMLIEEVKHFEASGLPVVRPNSMNHYGAILDEFGFEGMLDALMRAVVSPFAALLYAKQGGASLDQHHGFCVQYRLGEDRELSFHFDNCDVTLNVSLGVPGFVGGSVYFRGVLEHEETHGEYVEVAHEPGSALLHLGHHRHGALPLQHGERFNLILWCSSSTLRRVEAGCECASSAGEHRCGVHGGGSDKQEEHAHAHGDGHAHAHEHGGGHGDGHAHSPLSH